MCADSPCEDDRNVARDQLYVRLAQLIPWYEPTRAAARACEYDLQCERESRATCEDLFYRSHASTTALLG